MVITTDIEKCVFDLIPNIINDFIGPLLVIPDLTSLETINLVKREGYHLSPSSTNNDYINEFFETLLAFFKCIFNFQKINIDILNGYIITLKYMLKNSFIYILK